MNKVANLLCGGCFPVLYERVPDQHGALPISTCERCQAGFTFSAPKMHCRICDQTCCPKCYSTSSMVVVVFTNRVCDRCYATWEREQKFEKNYLDMLKSGVYVSKLSKGQSSAGFLSLEPDHTKVVWKSAEQQRNKPKEMEEFVLTTISGVWEGHGAQKSRSGAENKCFTIVSKEEGHGLFGTKKEKSMTVEFAQKGECEKWTTGLREAVAILKPKQDDAKTKAEEEEKRRDVMASRKKDNDKRKKELLKEVGGMKHSAMVMMERGPPKSKTMK